MNFCHSLYIDINFNNQSTFNIVLITLYTLDSIMLETVKMPPMTAHTCTRKCNKPSLVYQNFTVVGAKSYLITVFNTLIIHLVDGEL